MPQSQGLGDAEDLIIISKRLALLHIFRHHLPILPAEGIDSWPLPGRILLLSERYGAVLGGLESFFSISSKACRSSSLFIFAAFPIAFQMFFEIFTSVIFL